MRRRATKGLPTSPLSARSSPLAGALRRSGRGPGQLHHADNEELPPIARGSRVVDVVSGRRGCALTVSRSHCKVRFDPGPIGWKPEDEGPTEILPTWRLRVLTARWEGDLKQPAPEEFAGWHLSRSLVEAKSFVQPQRLGCTPRPKAGGACWSESGTARGDGLGERCWAEDLDALYLTDFQSPVKRPPTFLPHQLQAPPPLPLYLPALALLPGLLPGYDQPVPGPPLLSCTAIGFPLNEKPAPKPPMPPPPRPRQSPQAACRCLSTNTVVDEGEALFQRFVAVASHKFSGNLYGAWRLVLDVRGTGRVCFGDLVRGGRVIGFTGNFRLLWNVLLKKEYRVNCVAAGRGSSPLIEANAGATFEAMIEAPLDAFEREAMTIGLAALSPETWRSINEFRDFFQSRDMTLEDLWEQVLDPTNSGFCLFDHFCQELQKFGWDRRQAKALFRMFDVGGEQDISMDELELVGLERRAVDQVDSLTPRDMRKKQSVEANQAVVDNFIAFLHRTFGTIVRAWRLGLDADGDGRLRFQEFCTSCKDIGYRGKLKTLWKALDSKNTGYVTLGSMAPKAQALLDDFRTFLEEDYRTLDDVFERVLDTDRSGRVSQEEFFAACRDKLKYTGNVAKLFKHLDVKQNLNLTMQEVEFLGMRRRVAYTKTTRQLIAERLAKDKRDAEAMLTRFREFLKLRHGNLVRAWRLELDPDGDGRLQFTEFCKACRAMGFQGNMKALWISLDDDDTGFVELRELDPEAVQLFDEFTQILRIFFVDLDTAWYSTLDLDGSGKCDVGEFQLACQELGFKKEKASSLLFRYLDTPGQGLVSIKEMKVLGLPRAASKDEALQFARDSGAKAILEFEIHLKTMFKAPLVHAWRRGFCSGPCEEHLLQQLNAEEFCGILRRLNFRGNFQALWFQLLEGGLGSGWEFVRQRRKKKDGAEEMPVVNKHSYESRGVQFLVQTAGGASVRPSVVAGVAPTSGEHHGGLKLPLNALSELKRVSLRHIAPEVWQELTAFQDHCAGLFDSEDAVWAELLAQCLHTDFNTRLRKVEFVRAAKQIGFSGNAESVFEACDVEQEAQMSLAKFRFLRICPPPLEV